MTYESSAGLENISVNNTTTIPPPTVSQKVISQKMLKTVPFAFMTLKLMVYQMIVRLFKLQLLILMFPNCLISMFIHSNGTISFEATKVTGITKSSGRLFFSWEVSWCSLWSKRGLNRFGLCLKELCGRVVLLGDNVRAVDVKLLGIM